MHQKIQFQVKSLSQIKKATCLIVPVFSQRKLTAGGAHFDSVVDGAISRCLKLENFTGSQDKTLLLPAIDNTQCQKVLLVGFGKQSELNLEKFCKVLSSMSRALSGVHCKDAVCLLPEVPVKGVRIEQISRLICESILNAFYQFRDFKSKNDDAEKPLHSVTLVVNKNQVKSTEQAVCASQAIVSGMSLVKKVANTPANVCTPSYLADQAQQLAKRFSKLKVTVLDEKQLSKKGMNAFLAVAQGSEEPPRLITLHYQGGGAKDKPIVLVGKGVTFDSGGISLKPAGKMDEMKYDMCGAASVLGTIQAVCELKLPVNVVGVIPSTENMPSGTAIRPGDIVTSMSGQTIEILNTDAEGRLILCDALTYCEQFDPKVVIDIATLTGACVVALGRHPSAVMTNHQPLANALVKAGQQSHDRCWQLPLWDEYQSQLDSNFADMANIGGPEGGSITAGCFLSRFAKQFHWAHLDIAGTAWLGGKQKGATGRPVPLLTQFIINHC